MQTWPSHHRSPSSSAKSNNRNKKSTGNNYPVYGHGNLEAATLIQRNGRFEWDSLVSSSPTSNRFRLAKSFNVFPVTKSPPLPKPTATISQRADQGTHFLRIKFPEVDFSADVIRSQIKEDSLQAAELATFDPFEGNLLDIAVDCQKKKYLVFPTGELSSQLNLTPIVQGEDGKTVIKPTATPVRTFSTPIQQIALSPAPTIGETGQSVSSLLGIRTFGATSLLKFDSAAIASGGVKDLTYFTSHDLDGASVMDFKICSTTTPFGLLLVNNKGGIHGCNLAGGRKTMVKLYAEPEPPSKNSFWRIGTGARPTGCTVLSGKTFNHLDFRSNGLVPLYSAPEKDFLTSSEDYSQDGIYRLCSTSQIVWIDPRYPGKHLLGCRHYRQFERTLQTSTLFLDGSPTTFLSSRRNGLLTIYNVSRHQDHLMRVNDTPYGVLTSGAFCRFAGQAFLTTDPRIITIFRADERGGVDCFQFQSTTDDSTDLPDTITTEESNVIQELRKRAVNMKSDMDTFGDREKVVMDLFPAYSNIFRIHAERQEKIDENKTENEEGQAEEFYDLIDRLPIFWQTSDIPSEHMLTSYDIALRSHEGPSKSSRSDFTTGSLINSARGYCAILQGRFPIEELRKGAPWYLDTAEIQNRIDPSLDINLGARDLAHSLRSYDLIKDDDRTALSIQRENSAREHLVIDLALSKDVYSPSGFTPPREVGNDLEAMTEALSLGGDDEDEPPEVEFGCLAPIVRKRTTQEISHEHDEEIGADADGRVTLPMGVRLLLKDWEVGTKVKDYVYQDPYNTSGDSAPRFPAMSKLQRVNTMPSSLEVMNSQRPPTILPSQAPRHELGSVSQPLPVPVRSQYSSVRSSVNSQTVRQSVDGNSQLQSSQASTYQPNLVVNTQILSGPHGGRPSVPRKKPAKKRLGGF